jgi:tetratricopeptide (TPR) repeat protein
VRGRLDEALAASKEALRLAPGNTWLNLSAVCAALRDKGRTDEAVAFYKQAIAGYKQAVELEPNNADAHWRFGDALRSYGKVPEAQAEYREAIRLNPHHVWAYCNLAASLQDQKRLAEAEAVYREAIRRVGCGPVRSSFATFLDGQGRLKEAEAEYREAIHFEPDNWDYHRRLGLTLLSQGRDKEAEAEFSKAGKLQPENVWFWLERGRAYAELGHWEKASADFVKATECNAPRAIAWYYGAMLCLRDGDLDGYRKVCADMVRRFGKTDDLHSVSWLAWTGVLAPDAVADAAQLVLLAVKASGQSPQDHRNADLLGSALYRAGRYDDAAKRLTEASTSKPDERQTAMAYTWFFLAMTHHRLGHAAEARRWLEKGIKATEEALKPPAGPPEKSSNTAGPIPPSWNRKLTLRLLRREAEELIQGAGTKPAK